LSLPIFLAPARNAYASTPTSHDTFSTFYAASASASEPGQLYSLQLTFQCPYVLLQKRGVLPTISSERPPSERPSVIITDDINRLFRHLHGLEGDRQRDNQGIHDHLREIVQLKDQSVGEESVVSWRSPRGAPDYSPILPTVTSKVSPG